MRASGSRARGSRGLALAPLCALVIAAAVRAGPLPEPSPAIAQPKSEPAIAPSHAAPSIRPVVCYVETLFGGARPSELDLSVCTHVVDAFAVPDASGALTAFNGIPRRELMSSAREKKAQVLLAVGGATAAGKTFSQLAGDAAAQTRFFEALRQLVIKGGYDGVDLDWEFPRPGESALYLAFVRALRKSLDAAFRESRPGTRPLIFLGISPADAIEGYDFPALAAEADLFIEFGYDFKNPALGPWANDVQLWPDGSLRKIEGSVRGAASECVRRGLPREKLVIGLPLYTSDGRTWDAVRAKVLANEAPLHPLYLESPFDGGWVTGPHAIEAKGRKIFSGDEIAGGHAAGVALWQLGHQGTHAELTEALRRAIPPLAPKAPSPADGAALDGAPASLRWDESAGSPGAVDGYEIYLGSSREAVASAGPGSSESLGRVRNARIAAPGDLSGPVFWRVDVVGPGGSVHGETWSFSLPPRHP